MFKLLKGYKHKIPPRLIGRRYVGLSPGIMWTQMDTVAIFYMEPELFRVGENGEVPEISMTLRSEHITLEDFNVNSVNEFYIGRTIGTFCIYSAYDYNTGVLYSASNGNTDSLPLDVGLNIKGKYIEHVQNHEYE